MALSEIAYCTEEQIEGRIGYVLTTATKPTLVQASDFANSAYHQINGKLARKGVSTPIVIGVSPKSYEIVAKINAMIASAECLFSWSTPEQESSYAEAVRLRDDGAALLEDVCANPDMLSDAGVSPQGPSCYQTTHPEGREDEETESLPSDIARPFRIDKEY